MNKETTLPTNTTTIDQNSTKIILPLIVIARDVTLSIVEVMWIQHQEILVM